MIFKKATVLVLTAIILNFSAPKTALSESKIEKIEIQTNFSEIKETINRIKEKFTNQTANIESENQIQSIILSKMKERGFYSPEIKLKKIKSEHQPELMTYSFVINEGYPCLVDKIYTPFPIPSPETFELKYGDLCDLEQLKKSAENLSIRLKKTGYFQAQIQLEEIRTDPSRTLGSVFYKGSLGKQRLYRIKDVHSNKYRSDFLKERSSEEFYLKGFNLETIQAQILRFYNENGYAEAKIVDSYPSYEDEITTIYTIEIDLGSIFRVGEVIFLGNSKLSNSTLLNYMNIGGFLTSQVIYDQDKILDSLEKIRSEYQKIGYFNARATIANATNDKNSGQVKLIISINEGLYHQLSEVNVYGTQPETQKYINQFVRPLLKQPFYPEVVFKIDDYLKSIYTKLGYPYQEISKEIKETIRGNIAYISINFQLDSGPKSYFGKVSIEGLTKTEPQIILREINFEEGDLFLSEKLLNLRNKLMNLGIFKSVVITPILKSKNEPKPIDISIKVQDGSSGNVAFGPGFNLKKGLQYVGEVSYSNIGGKGRKMSFKTSISQEKDQSVPEDAERTYNTSRIGRKIGFGYVEPYLANLPITGNFSLLNTSAYQLVWSNSYTLELSSTYSPEWWFALKTNFTPYYRLKLNQDSGSNSQKDYLLSTGHSQIGSTGLRFALDARDSVEWPTSGFNFTQELSVAKYWLGGDYKYIQQDLAISTYLNLFADFVFGIYGNFTSFYDIHRENPNNPPVLPATERLLVSSSNQVRGFEKELGPYVYTEKGALKPLGANKRLILKMDLRKKIYKDNLAASLFLDSGNTFFSSEEETRLNSILVHESSDTNKPFIADNTPYTFNDIWKHPDYLWKKNYVSYGLALSLLSPLGAINISAAKALHEPESDTCERLEICSDRKSNNQKWYKSLKFDFSIGNQF